MNIKSKNCQKSKNVKDYPCNTKKEFNGISTHQVWILRSRNWNIILRSGHKNLECSVGKLLLLFEICTSVALKLEVGTTCLQLFSRLPLRECIEVLSRFLYGGTTCANFEALAIHLSFSDWRYHCMGCIFNYRSKHLFCYHHPPSTLILLEELVVQQENLSRCMKVYNLFGM